MSEIKELLDGWVAKIASQDRMTRQRALKDLLEFCQKDGNLTNDNSVNIFDTFYLCLIKCYSDKFEMCRSLSCSIVSEILKFVEQNDYYFGLLVPVIAKRVSRKR